MTPITLNELWTGLLGSLIFGFLLWDGRYHLQSRRACRTAQALAQQALAEIDAYYANAPFGLCRLDTNLRCVRLNAALAAVLQAADRRKDEFLAMLAHELRNPLAPIRSAAQILKRLGPAEPKLQWARDVIERQVKHLARLVDDLLDSARLVRGQITLKKEPVELATIIQQVVDAAQPLLEARQHQFHLTLPHSPVWLEGDPVRLVQVLLNLLDNAAKYIEPGGRIELKAEALDAEVAVRVRDTGPGLSPALLSRAFELFEQGERTLDRAQGGLGIGLTLVRRLVELHGGRVEAHGAGLGQGAEFTVWPPIRATGAPTAETVIPSVTARPAPNPRILLVDDDPDVVESLAMLLQLEGFEVRVAITGQAALDLARQFHPQIVLLDLGMPGMNGYKVARRLRERPPDEYSPRLIALTGYGDEETPQQVQEAGFTQHLVKPVEPDSLAHFTADRRLSAACRSAVPTAAGSRASWSAWAAPG